MKDQLLLFQLDDHQLGIRVSFVREIIRCVALTRPLAASRNVEGFFSLRGLTVPVLTLRKALGLGNKKVSPSDSLIVVENGGRVWALRADGGLATHEPDASGISPSSYHSLTPESFHVGDRIAFLLDVNAAENLLSADDWDPVATGDLSE